MTENAWHKKVQEEVFSRCDPAYTYQSHSDLSRLYLFRVAEGGKPRRIDCLSDADMVVLNSDLADISRIIEIESALNPKKIMGIVLATHLCNLCSIRSKQGEPKKYYQMKKVILEIVFKKAPKGSKKDYKLDVFEPFLDKIIKTINGSLLKTVFTAHE